MKILFMTVLYIRMSDEICTNMGKIMKIWKEFFFWSYGLVGMEMYTLEIALSMWNILKV